MVVGIRNSTGVACHLSCALQIIFHGIPVLREAFILWAQHECVGRSNCHEGDRESCNVIVLKTLGELFREMAQYRCSKSNSDEDAHDAIHAIDPSGYYSKLGIDTNNLGDAVKALRTLLHVLWVKPTTNEPLTSSSASSSSSMSVLQQILQQSLGGGRTLQRIVGCSSMKEERIKEKEKDMVQPYPVSGNQPTIRQCLEQPAVPIHGYVWPSEGEIGDTQGEGVSWETTKSTRVLQCPQHLLLHLQRFRYEGGRMVRLDQETDVPPELSIGDAEGPNVLCLCGAILHVDDRDEKERQEDEGEQSGQSEGGHYVVVVKETQSTGIGYDHDGQWYLIDDDKVHRLDKQIVPAVLSGRASLSQISGVLSATLLVYRQCHNGKNDRIETELLGDLERALDDETAQHEHAQQSLVGRRLKIRWAKGKFYSGLVQAYDPVTNKHTVLYDDNDVREYLLHKKVVQWIDEE